MTVKRDPWIKFYFTDFCGDPRVKLCSRPARSLWLEMLGIMHQATPYGFLLVEGIALNPQQLGNLVGEPERLVKAWLEELRQAGVYSVVGQPMPEDVAGMIPLDVPDGALLSRRMLRDQSKRESDRANGRRGGNRTLQAEGVKGGDNPPVNPTVNPPEGNGVKPKHGRGIRPRSQKPDTRYTPLPPSEPVNPPVALPCWEPHRDRSLRVFGEKFCFYWLFTCLLVPSGTEEWALEAPSRAVLSRLSVEGQRLQELLGRPVRFRLAKKVAA